MWKEFREFVSRGNVIDLAVGIIIGAAFGSIVKSLVEDIIMPPIGMVLGNIDFKDLFVALNGKAYASLAAAKEVGAPVIAYGNFINQVINFIILALVIFLLIKQINRLQRDPKTAPASPTTKDCPYCKLSIPIQAVRCPNCTSQIDGSPAPAQATQPARAKK